MANKEIEASDEVDELYVSVWFGLTVVDGRMGGRTCSFIRLTERMQWFDIFRNEIFTSSGDNLRSLRDEGCKPFN